MGGARARVTGLRLTLTAVIRQAGPQDVRFLRDVLKHAYHWRLNEDPDLPVARYVNNWGRPGDAGPWLAHSDMLSACATRTKNCPPLPRKSPGALRVAFPPNLSADEVLLLRSRSKRTGDPPRRFSAAGKTAAPRTAVPIGGTMGS